MAKEQSDKALVKSYQQGDLASYAELVERHYERLFRLASVYLAEPGFAADVTQEVFARAIKGFKGFLFRAEPGTWLYRTTRHVCHEYNRKYARQRAVQGEFADIRPMEDLAQCPSDEPIESSLVARKIRSLVAELPARQQEVVMLRIFEDLSVQETAALMGIRQGTVKANLHKALMNLRKRMNTEEFFDER